MEGYFPQVTGVQTITSYPGDDNMYSLQLNTNLFSTPECDGAPDPNCVGWQQFVYSNHGYVVMWYWLVNWGRPCPDYWLEHGAAHCVKHSDLDYVHSQAISEFSTLRLSGIAWPSSDQDFVYLDYHDQFGYYYAEAIGQDSVLHLAQGWKTAEYNVFGVDTGFMATFNPGSSIVVGLLSGGAVRTSCTPGASPTSEWNSLNLFGNCCFDTYRWWFFESNTGGTNRPACPKNALGSSCGGNDNCLSRICSNGICTAPPPKPTKQASSLVFMPPYEYSPGKLETAVGWQNGDGEATAIFVAAITSTTAGTPPPVVDGEIYLQNVTSPSDQGVDLSTFGEGSQIGNTGWYCVYNGTGTYVTLLGLESAVSYVVMAVTYNGYSLGVPVYLTSMAQDNPQNYPPPPAGGAVPATPAAGVAALAVILCATGMIRVSSRKSLSKAAGRRA